MQCEGIGMEAAKIFCVLSCVAGAGGWLFRYKTTMLKDPKHEFGALKSVGDWKPLGHKKGAKMRLQEGLEASSWKQVRAVINQTLFGHSVARGVMVAMLAEVKTLFMT